MLPVHNMSGTFFIYKLVQVSIVVFGPDVGIEERSQRKVPFGIMSCEEPVFCHLFYSIWSL